MRRRNDFATLHPWPIIAVLNIRNGFFMPDTPRSDELEPVLQLDRELVEAAKEVKVLSRLAWPPDAQEQFLTAWKRGNAALPEIEYERSIPGETPERLERIARSAESLSHPLARLVGDHALSYLTIVQLLDVVGTPEMTRHAISAYGKPGDALTAGGGMTNTDAARYFLEIGAEFYEQHADDDKDNDIEGSVVRDAMLTGMEPVFGKDLIRVVLDPNLASKAAAGATRVRLRDAPCFNASDAAQLLQHEVFVHTLTALNGQAQPHLTCLGLGAPRTTAPQEGLATFAELITGTIDIARLERVALRILAIDMALSGADFIDVFKYFLEAGQAPTESFNSAMRVFRGAPVTGGHAFTKDVVYLEGLLEVHTFFRWALKEQKLRLCQHFFAGRMTLGDVVRYEPFFESGVLNSPRYLPPWMTRTDGLAAYLAFSVFANGINLNSLDTEHDFEELA